MSEYITREARVEGNTATLTVETYNHVTETISEIGKAVTAEQQMQQETAILVKEASERLRGIEIEAYNNFKLMANGMITETITHELDSISKTSISPDADKHFDALRSCLVELDAVQMYVRQHPDHLAIAKLRTNIPLNKNDIESLESILWSEIGSKEE